MEGRDTGAWIAAQRCLQASRVAVDYETRSALQRAGVRYLLKSIGVEGASLESTDAPSPTDFLRRLGRRTEAGQAARHGAGRRAGLEW